MSKSKYIVDNSIQNRNDSPSDLSDHMFYGIRLDNDQIKFRDAIWSDNYDCIFCNSVAGTGKTTVAVATANLLVAYRKYSGIVYIASPYGERNQGYLPGDITQKSEVYFEPLYEALIKCNLCPHQIVNQDSIVDKKTNSGYVTAITHTYLRGCNLDNQVIIIDEAQNYDFESLRKTLTRCLDNCKVVVIGHSGQRDNGINNAFENYIEWFKDCERAAICTLNINHRGWISKHADSIKMEI